MATTYFARPKLQLFGVATGFVVRKIGLSDLTDALRLQNLHARHRDDGN